MRTQTASPAFTRRERKPMAAHAPRSWRSVASAEREREASRKERSHDGSPRMIAADEDG